MNTKKLLLFSVPLGALLLLGSHALFATQTRGIQVEMSSNGPLTPGTYREVTDSDGHGTQRQYRISKDAQGRLSESYSENGQPKPVLAAVRAWLRDEKTLMAPPAAPEIPPVPSPPAPPVIPVPPALPLPLLPASQKWD